MWWLFPFLSANVSSYDISMKFQAFCFLIYYSLISKTIFLFVSLLLLNGLFSSAFSVLSFLVILPFFLGLVLPLTYHTFHCFFCCFLNYNHQFTLHIIFHKAWNLSSISLWNSVNTDLFRMCFLLYFYS